MTDTLDPTTEAGARAIEHLAGDRTGWLTTVDADGQPMSSPIWFLWADREILVYSHRRARRNTHLAVQPRVAFNLNTDASGDEFVTMEGTARIDPEAPSAAENPAYLEKYAGHIADNDWTNEWFATEYPYAVRITPTRWRT